MAYILRQDKTSKLLLANCAGEPKKVPDLPRCLQLKDIEPHYKEVFQGQRLTPVYQEIHASCRTNKKQSLSSLYSSQEALTSELTKSLPIA